MFLVHYFTDLVYGGHGCIISEHVHGKMGHYVKEDDIQQSKDKLFKGMPLETYILYLGLVT